MTSLPILKRNVNNMKLFQPKPLTFCLTQKRERPSIDMARKVWKATWGGIAIPQTNIHSQIILVILPVPEVSMVILIRLKYSDRSSEHVILSQIYCFKTIFIITIIIDLIPLGKLLLIYLRLLTNRLMTHFQLLSVILVSFITLHLIFGLTMLGGTALFQLVISRWHLT